VVLLVGALLVVRSLQQAVHVSIGFNPQNAVTASVDLQNEGYTEQRAREFQRRLIDRLSALPQAEAVALTDRLPLGIDQRDSVVYVEGKPVRPAPQTPSAIPYEISVGYFRAMQTRLVAGRDFDARDNGNARLVAIVNQAFAAKFFPGQNAIGKRFRRSRPENELIQIVGIAEDGKYQSLSEDRAPAMFFPMEQRFTGDTAVVFRSPAPPQVSLDAIRRVIAGLDPSISLYAVDTVAGHLGFALFPARVAAVCAVRLRVARHRSRSYRHLWSHCLRGVPPHSRDRNSHGHRSQACRSSALGARPHRHSPRHRYAGWNRPCFRSHTILFAGIVQRQSHRPCLLCFGHRPHDPDRFPRQPHPGLARHVDRCNGRAAGRVTPGRQKNAILFGGPRARTPMKDPN
jgi:hypothetical protein